MASSWITFLVLLYVVWGSLGVRILNCNNINNQVEIFEDSPVPVTCGDITSTADVVWLQGNGVNIGECRGDGTCSSDLYTNYSLNRSPQSRESQLTLVPDYRRHAGVTVTCQEKGGLPTATCTLVIRRHSVVSECQVTNNPVDWTVSGSCRVQEAFSSDNNYSCSWKRNDGKQTFGGFDSTRERCSFSNQPLPPEDGVYTYTILVFPPPTTGFSQTVTRGNGTAADSTHESSGSLTGIIAGVVIAGAVIVILITVIAIVINRRKFKFHAVTKGKPSNETFDDFEEHINVVYRPTDGQCQQVAGPEEHYYSIPDDVTSTSWSASTTTAGGPNKAARHVSAVYDNHRFLAPCQQQS